MSRVFHAVFHAVFSGAQLAFVYAQVHPELIGLIPQPVGIVVSSAFAAISAGVAVYNHAKGK